jgi:hypothetical protein
VRHQHMKVCVDSDSGALVAETDGDLTDAGHSAASMGGAVDDASNSRPRRLIAGYKRFGTAFLGNGLHDFVLADSSLMRPS